MGKSKDLANGETRFANVSGDTFTGLVNITNTYSSDTTEQLRVSDNTGSKLDFFGHANGTKSIQAYADDGSTFYNLNLQPLGGSVTTPNQPAFNAYSTTSLTTNTASTWTLVTNWTGTRFNNSNSFDTSNGRFTAPVAGEYLFAVTNNMGSGHNVKSWRLYKNGGAFIVISYADVTATWSNASGSALVSLNASDYIQFSYRGQPDYGWDWINVYGYLLG